MRAYVSNVRDVTDRMTADLSLRRSESNFRTLIERLPMATVVHRLGRIIYVNPAAAAMLGYDSVDGVVGRPVFEIVHPDDHDHVRARIELMQRDGGAPPQEVRILRSDGSVAIVEAEGVMLDFDGQPANVVLARDISERRELFARIAMADRMLSVGTLAAGVAHEINNPLAYVVSNLEVLANELPELLSEQGPEGSRFDRDEVAALIAEAREGAERVSAIVRDLRSLSRPANDTLAPVDVVGVLSSSIRMANNELKHRARVIQTYAADLPRVRANASRLGQVFVNLLINAAHAIDEGHAETNEVRVRASSSADRKSVIVEIEDTGAGMPPKIVARIFDPFFTTKPVGVGIGLGLSISHQIVQSIGGEMSVTSTVGQGTTFRVTLRASVAEPFLEPVETTGSSTPPLRILMIDDEAAVGRAVRALLEPDHEVVPVTRAKTALSRLVAGETFDVILCDLMMPEMSGIEFYMELVRLVPHYQDRVVFVTGGAFTEQAREFLARTKHTRIEKPFTEEQLRRAIDSVSNSTT
jgi:PAS domain S-box-containing protein